MMFVRHNFLTAMLLLSYAGTACSSGLPDEEQTGAAERSEDDAASGGMAGGRAGAGGPGRSAAEGGARATAGGRSGSAAGGIGGSADGGTGGSAKGGSGGAKATPAGGSGSVTGGSGGAGGAGGTGGGSSPGSSGGPVEHDPVTFEPNDSPGSAAPIELGALIESSEGNGDAVDFYRVAVMADHVYTVSVKLKQTCGGSARVSVLQGSDGKQGELVDNNVGVYDFAPTASGDILISVALGCANEVAYALRVLPSTDDGLEHDAVTHEPNDSPNTSAPLDLNESISGSQPSDDKADYYRLDVKKDATYTVELGAKSCGGIWKVVVNNGKDGTRGKLLDTSSAVTEFIASETGPVTLQVSESCSDESPYTLVVRPSTDEGLDHDAVTFEPNNSPSTAAPIAEGQMVMSSLPSGDAIDYYRVELKGQKTYSLELKTSSCGGIWTVTAAGGKDGMRGKLRDGAGTFSTLEDGLVLISVKHSCGANSTPYTLLVTATGS